MNELTHDEQNAARLFGLQDTFQPLINVFLPSFKLPKGRIVSITGDSGTGKTLFLEMLEKSLTEKVCNLNSIRFNRSKSAFQNVFQQLKSTDKSLKLLGKSGLAEAGLILRPVKTYSAGETFRFKLALAIARKYKVLVIDEFGMQLDEILAKNIAFSLRKMADRERITVIAASCSETYLRDLQPDIAFKLDETGVRVCTKYTRRRKISFHMRLKVKRADIKTWKNFAQWHYKSHHTGPTSDIFTLNLDDKPIGIIVYGYPSLFSSPRNKVTNNRYTFNQPDFARKINSEVRIIRRVVMMPKFRGVGLAAELVRKSLKLLPADIRYVECMTSMGEYCGFLENADFEFVKKTETPKVVQKFKNTLILNNFNEKNTSANMFLAWLNSLPNENRQQVRKLLMKVIEMRLSIKNSSLRKKELSETQNTTRFHTMIEEALAVRFTRPMYFIKDLRRMS